MSSAEATTRPTVRRAKLVSVILPVFNEESILEELSRSIQAVLDGLASAYELIFVDDGSVDRSSEILDRLAAASNSVRVVHLSRNFGHQAAVHAGLSCAAGDVVVVMDSDMQDDPAAIPLLVAEWELGTDVVYAIRSSRKEGVAERLLFRSFYRLLSLVSDTRIPLDAGNFGLIDRRIVDLVAGMHEHDRYYPGLRAWVGFAQKGIKIDRMARYDARPRVGRRGLFRLAKTAVFSFSSFPMAFFYFVAVASLILCIGLSTFTLYHKLFTGLAIPGWTSYLLTMSFFGALNALGISVLGEYVIRIYDQVRNRPGYIIDRVTNIDPDRRTPPSRQPPQVR